MEANPGYYYHEKACEAAYVEKLLETETDPQERKRLEHRLEMALYVGD